MSLFKSVTRKKRRPAYRKYKQYDFDFYGRSLLVQGYERQALRYLADTGLFKPSDILTEEEFGDGLQIRYKYGKRTRKYFPDIFIRSHNIIVEVKSLSTLGLIHNKKRGWSMTCHKAIACHKKGYKFCLLLMTEKGERIFLPKKWARMKKAEVKDYVNVQLKNIKEERQQKPTFKV